MQNICSERWYRNWEKKTCGKKWLKLKACCFVGNLAQHTIYSIVFEVFISVKTKNNHIFSQSAAFLFHILQFPLSSDNDLLIH